MFILVAAEMSMDSLKLWLSHTLHASICKKNISILDLMLRAVRCNIHSIKPFDKIAFSKDSSYYSETTGWDDSFISKFNAEILLKHLQKWLG
ncbi:hypothetical protein [Butyrivibrio sp. ob235]|uniref:hypothetical protein n=1 Tax=Butyrivibrio sp. ob235 TaxID=1761780 RepID=UPI0015875E19|nr:hypothetical protein [Butyrivibrio sp. ob235]